MEKATKRTPQFRNDTSIIKAYQSIITSKRTKTRTSLGILPKCFNPLAKSPRLASWMRTTRLVWYAQILFQSQLPRTAPDPLAVEELAAPRGPSSSSSTTRCSSVAGGMAWPFPPAAAPVGGEAGTVRELNQKKTRCEWRAVGVKVLRNQTDEFWRALLLKNHDCLNFYKFNHSIMLASYICSLNITSCYPLKTNNPLQKVAKQ